MLMIRSYNILGLPPGANIERDTGLFVWPSEAQRVGVYDLVFIANDGQVSTRQNLEIKFSTRSSITTEWCG